MQDRSASPSSPRALGPQDDGGWIGALDGVRVKDLAFETAGLVCQARLLRVDSGVDLTVPVEMDRLNVLLAGCTTVDWYADSRALTGTVGEGAVTLIPASDRHRFRFRGRSTSLSLSLDGGLLPALAQEGAGRGLPHAVPPLLGRDDQPLFRTCRALVDALEAPEPRDPLELDGLATVVGAEIGRLLVPGDRAGLADARGRLRQAQILDYIEDHIGEPLRLDALAARAGLSRTHFVRDFRRLTGQSPHRYVTARRIARAKPLLADPGAPLAQIAYDLGFSSQSHFTTAFARATGTTPMAFRTAVT